MNDLKSNIERCLANLNPSIKWDDVVSIIDGVNASSLAPHDTSWLSMLGSEITPALESYLIDLLESRSAKTGIKAGHGNSKKKLTELRKILAKMNVDGLILPRADEHQGEYIPPGAERLAWLTGFDGSAGFAIILQNTAAVFTDGRYTLQIRQQVDQNYFDVEHIVENPPIKWLEQKIVPGNRIGFDPWLHTADAIRQFENLINQKGGKLVPLNLNPVDEIWTHQPSIPLSPIVPHDIIYSGKSSIDKKKMVCETLKQNDEDAVVLSSPESIAWLLNIRGSDVPRTPLPCLLYTSPSPRD